VASGVSSNKVALVRLCKIAGIAAPGIIHACIWRMFPPEVLRKE
jgi:hypothetical protein